MLFIKKIKLGIVKFYIKRVKFQVRNVAHLHYSLEIRQNCRTFKPVYLNSGQIFENFLRSFESHLKGLLGGISLLIVVSDFAWKTMVETKKMVHWVIK